MKNDLRNRSYQGFCLFPLTARIFENHSPDDDVLGQYRIFTAATQPVHLIAKVMNENKCMTLRSREEKNA